MHCELTHSLGATVDLEDTSPSLGALVAAIVFGGFLAGLFFVVVERRNRFVVFWSWMTTMYFGVSFAVSLFLILLAAPLHSVLLSSIFGLVQFAALIVSILIAAAAYRSARHGRLPSWPLVGIAERRSRHLNVPSREKADLVWPSDTTVWA